MDGLQSWWWPQTPIYGNGSSYTLFTSAVLRHYASMSAQAAALSVHGTRHEPHVAELALLAALDRAAVAVHTGVQLLAATTTAAATTTMATTAAAAAARRTGHEAHIGASKVASIRVRFSNSTVADIAAMHYVDATYTGDLLAAAGAAYHVRHTRLHHCVPSFQTTH